MPQASIVIPVYNGELYIEQCLNSACGQSLKDIEIICVDDGSTDNTPQIIQEYINKDPRIKLLTQANQYAGVARNNALNIATGEYIIFLDVDDILTEDAAEQFYNTAKRTYADVVLCRLAFFSDDADNATVSSDSLRSDFLPNKETVSAAEIYPFVFNLTSGAPGGKCFANAYIKEKNLKFLELCKSEDFYFTHLGMALADRISIVDYALYLKRNAETSLEHQKDNAPLVFWEAVELFEKRLKDENVFSKVEFSFINSNVDRFAYNMRSMNTKAGYEAVFGKLKEIYQTKLGIGIKPDKYYFPSFANYRYLCEQLGRELETKDIPVFSFEEKLKRTETQLCSANKEIEQMRRAAIEIKSKNDRLEESLKTADRNLTLTKDKLNNTQAEVKKLRESASKLETKNTNLKQDNKALKKRLAKTEKTLDNIKSSYSYRIARKLAWPVRKIRKCFNKTK